MSIFEVTNTSDLSNTSWNSEPARRMSEEFFAKAWPKWFFQLAIAVIGSAGNSVIICAFRKKLKANIANYYIFCLALVDLFSCSVAIPLHIVHNAFYFTFTDNISCKLLQWLRSALWASSAIILQAIAVDRYRAVCKPFSWRKLKNTKTIIIITLCVFTGFALSFPLLFISGPQGYLVRQSVAENYGFSYAFEDLQMTFTKVYICETLNIYDNSWINIATSVVALLTFVFLVTVTLICYTIVYTTMRKHMKARQPKNKIVPSNLTLSSAIGNTLTVVCNDAKSTALSPGLNPEEASAVSSRVEVEHSNTNSMVKRTKVPSSRQSQYGAAKTFMIVTVAFLTTWIPFWVQAVLAIVDSRFNHYPNLIYHIGVDFCRELYFINSAFNAFIYYFFNAMFRQYCQDTFGICRNKVKVKCTPNNGI